MATYLIAGVVAYSNAGAASSARTAAAAPISTYAAVDSTLSTLTAGLTSPTTTTVSVSVSVAEGNALACFNALLSALATQPRTTVRLSLMRLP